MRMFNSTSITNAANLTKLHEASQLFYEASRFLTFPKYQGLLPLTYLVGTITYMQIWTWLLNSYLFRRDVKSFCVQILIDGNIILIEIFLFSRGACKLHLMK